MSLQPHALVAAATLVQVALRVGSLRCTVQQRLFCFAFDIAIQSSSADGGELVGVGLCRPRTFSHLGHEHIFFFFFGWESSVPGIQDCQKSDLLDEPSGSKCSV